MENGNLRSWLGLSASPPLSAASTSTSASSTVGSTRKKTRNPWADARNTPKEALRRNASVGGQSAAASTTSVETPKSDNKPRHVWGGIVRNSTWPRAKRDESEAKRERKGDTITAVRSIVEIHDPYTGRFVWPAGDYARWPGSGDYAFDSIRREPAVPPTATTSLGAQLKRLIDFANCPIAELTTPLEVICTDSSLMNVLATFYYRRRCRWTRFDKIKDESFSLSDIRRLVDLGAMKEFKESEQDLNVLATCYSLLTVDELREVCDSGALLKDRLVHATVTQHAQVYPLARDKVGGGIFALDGQLFSCLVRLHQYVFSASNFEPEDASEYLKSGVLATIDLVEPECTELTQEACVSCWEQLKESLDEMACMAHHVPRGESEPVFKSLHAASTLLLAANRKCSCWMSHRVLENCIRIVNLGVALMEREKRYEDALHYLKLTLGVLESRFVISLDEEDDDVDPDTKLSFHRARLLHRYCVDLCHLDRKNEALEELERILGEANGILWSVDSPRKTLSMNRIGGLGAGLISLYLRLSEPPRRWKPKLAVTLIDMPEEHICIKRDVQKSVETLSAEYFLSTGQWQQAQHCENGLVHTMFGLLFSTNTRSRRTKLDDSLITKNKMEIEQLLIRIKAGEGPAMIQEAWTRYHGKQIRGVNWKRNSLNDLMLIAKNLGPSPLAMICTLLSDAYEAWCGGLSDLLLWNEHKVRFVEIKGPGDSLSNRQRAWGEKLFLSGADVCVCYVTWKQDPETAAAAGSVSTFVQNTGNTLPISKKSKTSNVTDCSSSDVEELDLVEPVPYVIDDCEEDDDDCDEEVFFVDEQKR